MHVVLFSFVVPFSARRGLCHVPRGVGGVLGLLALVSSDQWPEGGVCIRVDGGVLF